jgi:hypothetical protein
MRLNGLSTPLTRPELLSAGGHLQVLAEATPPVLHPAASKAEPAAPDAPEELSSFLSMCRFLSRFRVSFGTLVLCSAYAACIFIYIRVAESSGGL